MTKKVKVAVFDRDLRVRTSGNFPLTQDGSKIAVRSGGKRHFNPSFDNDSFLEFSKRSYIPPFKRSWERVYIIRNGARKCVNFQTELVTGPDPKLVMDAASNKLLETIGKDKVETPILLYIILAFVAITALKVLGVIV